MTTLLTLAWRNLWRKKRRTLITASSVAFAVILAVFLMSMITGMKERMVETILRNTTGHLQILDILYDDQPSIDHSLEYGDEVLGALARYPEDILFTVPRIRAFCLAAKDMGSRGVLVTGIVPEKEDRMNELSSRMVQGAMFGPEDDFAVIGEGLARQLDLSVGDTLILLGQGFQGLTAAGRYPVGGLIRFRLPEQNNTAVFLPLREAQDFFAAPDRLTHLIVMAADESRVPVLAQNLRDNLDEEWHVVKTWRELMPDSVAAFEARDAQVRLLAWVLYVVVGFGILGTVMMMMYERLREFGILMSIGLKRARLAAVCLLETLLISIIGVLAGTAVGLPLIYLLHRNPIVQTGALAEASLEFGVEPVYFFSMAPGIFVQQAVTVFVIAVAVGLFPVWKIFKLDVVDAARK